MDLKKLKIEVMRYQSLILSSTNNPPVPRIHHQILRKIREKLGFLGVKTKSFKKMPFKTDNNQAFEEIKIGIQLHGGIGDIC